MDNNNRHDLKISGSASASGGTYNNVTINGKGVINGDIDCIDFKINGACDINGNVKTVSGKINGASDIKGSVQADDFKIAGATNIQGDLNVKNLKIEGAADIRGNLISEEIELRGGFKVKGNCNAEIFSAKGGFQIDGMLNAGQVEIDLYHHCSVKEIGGEIINVRHGTVFRLKNLIKSIFLPIDLRGGLKAETIEGDDIYLEFTTAKVVRGNNIKIGTDCEIDLVEYKNEFVKLDNAIVKETRKI